MIDENDAKEIRKLALEELMAVARRIEMGSRTPMEKEAAQIVQRFTREQMLAQGLALDSEDDGSLDADI